MSRPIRKPPRFLEFLLRSVLSAGEKESVCGDLEEIFNDVCEAKGRGRGFLWYLRQVLAGLPRYSALILYWRTTMLISSLRLAFRRLRRFPISTGITIVGLAIGLTFFALLAAFIHDDQTFDRFHERADRIHILTSQFRDRFLGGSHHFVAEMLEAEFPEIRSAVRFAQREQLVRMRDRIFRKQIAYTDPGFFALFSFRVAAGSPVTAWNSSDGIVLSRETAESLFGVSDPVGRTLSVFIGNAYRDVVVAGVLEDFPSDSSIRFDGLLPFRFSFESFDVDPGNNDFVTLPMFSTTILDIPDPADAARLRPKLADFNKRLYGPMWEKVGMDVPEPGLDLLPLTDYHLGDVVISGFLPRSRRIYSFILAAIALLVLVLACFNSVNLALAGGEARLKEIGVRKVIGADKRQIVGLLFTDSILIAGLALLGALGLVSLLLPSFNAMTGKEFALFVLLRPAVLLILGASLSAVVLLTGLSPALALSRFSAVDLFRERRGPRRKGLVSQGLIIFQFAVSIFLLLGAQIMIRQLRFMTTADLGYNPGNILVLDTQISPHQSQEGVRLFEIFRGELRNDARVLSVTANSGTVSGPNGGITRLYDMEGVEYRCDFFLVTPGFIETLEIPLLSGRSLRFEGADFEKDEVLVNSAFVRDFGVEDPIGRRLSDIAVDKMPPEYSFDPVIVGVIDDFHLSSLHDPISPAAFGPMGFPVIQRFRKILVRFRPGEGETVRRRMEGIWTRIQPDLPFSAGLLTDRLQGYYARERSWSRIVGWSAAMALFIACMGLFGLTGINVARRTKETGIRKVLGAGAGGIFFLFFRRIFAWILVANVLAAPAAFIAARVWLNEFAFRIDIGIGIFAAAGFISLLISGLTVSWHVGRTALSDPVQALRYE